MLELIHSLKVDRQSWGKIQAISSVVYVSHKSTSSMLAN